MYIKAYNIKYNAEDNASSDPELPTTLFFEIDEDVDKKYLETFLSEHVTDHTGVCVESLSFEILEHAPDEIE